MFEHDLFGKPVPTFPDHALDPSALETGFVARSPDITRSTRGTGPGSGRAFVPYGRAGAPAVDDAGTVGRAMATRAASVCGLGRAEDCEAAGE